MLRLLFLAPPVSAVYSNSLAQFPSGSPWTIDVSSMAPDPNSAAMITATAAFGTNPIQFDASINALFANCSTPRVPFYQASGYYSPDCLDSIPMGFPLPDIGGIEGFTNWTDSVGCAITGNDCHVSVLDEPSGVLYEGYQCDVTVNGQGKPTSLTCLCALTWDTNYLYPGSGRGEGCTSVDAAGFPLQTLLATPEEAATSIDHAIRFILPNNKMRKLSYRHPASHYGGPSSTNAMAIPYGARIRLRGNFSEVGFSSGPLAFIKALKKYGAFLSDGGNLPFTIANDAFRAMKWKDVGFTDFTPFNSAMSLKDFEVLPAFGSAPNEFTSYNCISIPYSPVIPNCSAGGVQTKSPTRSSSSSPTRSPTTSPTRSPTTTNKPTTSRPTSSKPTSSTTSTPTTTHAPTTNKPTSSTLTKSPTTTPTTTHSPTHSPTTKTATGSPTTTATTTHAPTPLGQTAGPTATPATSTHAPTVSGSGTTTMAPSSSPTQTRPLGYQYTLNICATPTPTTFNITCLLNELEQVVSSITPPGWLLVKDGAQDFQQGVNTTTKCGWVSVVIPQAIIPTPILTDSLFPTSLIIDFQSTTYSSLVNAHCAVKSATLQASVLLVEDCGTFWEVPSLNCKTPLHSGAHSITAGFLGLMMAAIPLTFSFLLL